MIFHATPEQQSIIEAVAFGQTIKVAALAGTGKTSTLVMIANTYPTCKGLYLAYNKALQLEAEKKFPPWVQCKTVHGLAYGVFGKQFRPQLMTRRSFQEIIAEIEIEEFSAGFKIDIDEETLLFTDSKMLSWTREIVRHFMFSNRQTIEIDEVAWLTQSELPNDYPELAKGKEFYQANKSLVHELYTRLNSFLLIYARELWRQQSDVNNLAVPAEHDTYLKLYQLSKPSITDYDYIMLDEAQDANPCIIDILSHQTCQVIYVGDEYQQIYSYRGTMNAMKTIEAETYPLTQSFRFGEVIAKEANVMLKHLHSPSRLKGLPSITSSLGDVTIPYTYIGRTNLKLFEACIDKIEEGYKCCFTGDMKGTLSLMRAAFSLWCKKPEWVRDSRISIFPDWDALMTFAREEEDQQLLMPINFIMKHGPEAIDKIQIIESEGRYKEYAADIIFTTAHKAKGREWARGCVRR